MLLPSPTFLLHSLRPFMSFLTTTLHSFPPSFMPSFFSSYRISSLITLSFQYLFPTIFIWFLPTCLFLPSFISSFSSVSCLTGDILHSCLSFSFLSPYLPIFLSSFIPSFIHIHAFWTSTIFFLNLHNVFNRTCINVFCIFINVSSICMFSMALA